MRTKPRIIVILATLALIGLALVRTESQSGRPQQLFDAALLGERSKVAAMLKQRPTLGLFYFSTVRRALKLRAEFAAAIRHENATEMDSMLQQTPALVNAQDVIPAADFGGNTPLHIVAGAIGKVDLVKVLLSHGADVNAKNRAGLTPLHRAVLVDSVEIVKLLIAHKVEIDAPDREGATALYYGVQFSSEAMVKLLLSAGAAPDAKARDGETPATVAPNEAIRNLLKEWEYKGNGKRVPTDALK